MCIPRVRSLVSLGIFGGVVALAALTSGCTSDPMSSGATGLGGAPGNVGGDRGGSGGKAGAGGIAQSGGGSGNTGAGGSGAKGGTAGAVGTGGSAGGSAGTTTAPTDASLSIDLAPPMDLGAEVASSPGPYGCVGCKRIFDGKTLDGWVTVPGAWEVKGEAMASQGKESSIWTKDDFRTYRLFFQVRQVKPDHDPCVVLFGKRPVGNQGRDLGGAQFQPPNGSNWNYGAGGQFVQTAPNPPFDKSKWNQCEVLVKEASSDTTADASFRVACCPVGATPCKTKEVVRWSKGKGRNHPICFMLHNGGIFDEYKDVWVEENPTDTEFLSMK